MLTQRWIRSCLCDSKMLYKYFSPPESFGKTRFVSFVASSFIIYTNMICGDERPVTRHGSFDGQSLAFFISHELFDGLHSPSLA